MFQILQAQGKYQNKPALPFTLGSEFAGRIARNSPIPKGCPYKAGDRVFGASQGAFADKVAVDWERLITLPDNVPFDQGAGAHWYLLSLSTPIFMDLVTKACSSPGPPATRL
jgi:NADPH2:quinone reductase